MLPRTPREEALANFWYHKGYGEAELMAHVSKNKKRVELVVTTKKRATKRA